MRSSRSRRRRLPGAARGAGLPLPSLGPTERRPGRRRARRAAALLAARALARGRRPAYVVLHDATLRDLAAARPASLHELAAVKGFGPTKIERYGDDLLGWSQLVAGRGGAEARVSGLESARPLPFESFKEYPHMQRVRGLRGLELTVLRLRRSTKAPRKRGRIRKLRLLAVLTVLVLLAGTAFTFGLVRAVASEIPHLDPAAQPRRSTGRSTRRTATPSWPCSAATRAASCSRTSATSRRSCARRSSRSRTGASTSTTASTRAESCARSGRTSARRASSRAARRSRSSS